MNAPTPEVILRYKPYGRRLVAFVVAWQMALPTGLVSAASSGQIEQIDIQETGKTVAVTLRGRDIGKCQPALLRDPKNRRLPMISLPFQETSLNPTLQGTQAGAGSVLSVDAQQILTSPVSVTQVLVSLGDDVHYKLKRNATTVVIEVENRVEALSTEAPAATPSTALDASRPRQTLQPGDVVFVAISPAEELSRELVVDQNGKLSLPLLGAIDAAGQTADGLAHKLATMLAKYVSNPHVDVLIKQFNSQQISLVGQVRNPGAYPYRANLRLLDLVSMAGGFVAGANKSQVRIYRGTGAARKATVVDVGEVMKTSDVTKDFLLQPGDLIDVPKGVNPLTIFGDIDHSGTYDYYHNMRLLDLVSLAQGFKDGADANRVIIYRAEPPFQKIIRVRFAGVMEGKMDNNILLEPGDVIFVPARALWTYSAVAQTLTPITTLLLTAATIFLASKK